MGQNNSFYTTGVAFDSFPRQQPQPSCGGQAIGHHPAVQLGTWRKTDVIITLGDKLKKGIEAVHLACQC